MADLFTSALYKRSPVRVQEAMISARARLRRAAREGEGFRNALQQARERQWWPRERIEEFQRRELLRVLRHAAEHVPFYRKYRELLRDRTVDDIEEALRQFPVIDRRTVATAYRDFQAADTRGPLIKGGTSGTSGSPLTIKRTLSDVTRGHAFNWRQLEWAGYGKGQPRAWIRGETIVPYDRIHPPFWRQNRAENTLMISSYHLSPKNAAVIIEALEAFDPILIQAYPSSIGFLAAHLEAQGRDYIGRRLRAIVTSSETLTESRRRLIESRFGCRLFDLYGNYEWVAQIATCEQGSYHLVSDCAYVELEPQEDGSAGIVGTGFINRAMPLIRYRTGDFVIPSLDPFGCSCGRPFPRVEDVLGRVDDVVKTKDGRRIERLDHMFKNLSGMAEAQIVQETLEQVRILIVPLYENGKLDEGKLLNSAQERLGNEMRVSIEYVDTLPRTSRGKLQGVVCRL